ncbi:MAG: Hsp20/alpha crystallin family protein [bacterium]
MEKRIAKFFDDFNNNTLADDMFFNKKNIYIPHNTIKSQDMFILELSLPGYKKEDVNIDIDDEILTIYGERKMDFDDKDNKYLVNNIKDEEFKKIFEIENNIEKDRIKANFENGILKIFLPIKENEKPKSISIE